MFSAVYTGSAVGITEAFNFLVDNHKRIEERLVRITQHSATTNNNNNSLCSYSSMNALGNIVRGIAERFTSQEQMSQVHLYRI